MLLNILMPSDMVQSVTNIDLDDLAARGIRGILLDFDNTLLAWSQDRVSAKVKSWVKHATERGFRLCIVSNAPDQRLMSQAKRLQIPFVSQAMKPTGKGINRAIELLGGSIKTKSPWWATKCSPMFWRAIVKVSSPFW